MLPPVDATTDSVIVVMVTACVSQDSMASTARLTYVPQHVVASMDIVLRATSEERFPWSLPLACATRLSPGSHAKATLALHWTVDCMGPATQ